MTKLSLLAVVSLALQCFAAPGQASPATEVAGKLVSLQGKSVKKFDGATLADKKFVALYYSAAWCGPCRKFTPKLVGWYNANKAKYPQFELIFVSSDRSEPEMEEYMKADDMPWPALDFGKIRTSKDITQYAGNGIPCLVFLDETGKVLSHSYEGENYVGPNKVLRDMEKMLAAGPASPVSAPVVAGGEAQPASKIGTGKFDIFADKK